MTPNAPAPAASPGLLELPGGSWPLAALALVVLSAWATLRLQRWGRRRSLVRRAARAQAAEREAFELLEARGYEVLGRQVRQSFRLTADGEEVRFTLIADYVVERAGRRWVAEVKTGERALDLRYGPTRRQLLEYREAFGVQGVLLVDAEGRRLLRVEFDGTPASRGARGPLTFAAGVAAGLALAALLAHGCAGLG